MDKQTESRNQFEAWFKEKIIETPDFVFNEFNEDEGEYIVTEDDNIDLYIHIQEMYMAWQVSRAAIVVDLEHIGNVQVEEGAFYLDEAGVKDTLRSIGITVKE